MENIRLPFFIAAGAIWLVVLIGEASSGPLLKFIASHAQQTEQRAKSLTIGQALPPDTSEEQKADIIKAAQQQPSGAPCYGIQKLSMFDALVAYSLLLMTLYMLKLERLKGYLQGIGTLILSLLALIGTVVLVIAGVVKLLIMVSLLMAVPFGTIAYLIIWGSFDRGGAAATLGAIMFLKIGFAVCLLLAQQDFIKNKALVTLILVSLLLGIITSFLHALVPSILDNITDTVAGLISMVFAAIWFLILLIGSVIKVVKDVL